jgi:hypothetical protein
VFAEPAADCAVLAELVELLAAVCAVVAEDDAAEA